MKQLFLLIAIMYLSCSSKNNMHNDFDGKITFDKEGHRGCRGLMPENTIPAFKKAIDLGVTTLEMDAIVTKDKQIIISHEPFFNHEITTKADGSFVDEKEERLLNIYGMTYEQTLQFDVGMKPHPRFPMQQKMKVHKPRLVDVIDSAEAYTKLKSLPPIQYNIETKSLPETDDIYHPQPAEYVELIMSVIKQKNIQDRVIIQSFDMRTLQYLYKKYPTIRTAYLYEPPSVKNFATRLIDLGFIPTIYSPEYTTVTPALVAECKNLDIKLIPWTVDDLENMKKLKLMGVDGIISDYPNLYEQLE